MDNTILVTGGAGFIGSNFILRWMEREVAAVLNLDKLTYAGNLHNLASVAHDRRYEFVEGDIADRSVLRSLFDRRKPRSVVHSAAESHVDRSIRGPEDFIRTNIDGTFALLEETRAYWEKLNAKDRVDFRFLHVSTDEVYGSLGQRILLFPRPLLTLRTVRTLRRRRPPITWCALINTLTICPR